MGLLANSELLLYLLGLKQALTNELQVVVICPEEEQQAKTNTKHSTTPTPL